MSGSLWNPQNDPVALQAGKGVTQPINFLETAGQAQQLQSNALGIQQQQRTQAAQQALGQAAQNAIDPNTGAFNTQAFMQGIKTDPDAQYGASAAITTGQDQAKNQYGLNQDQLNQANAQINSVGAGMSGLLSNPNLTPQDIYGAVAGQGRAGKPVGAFVTSVLPGMPTQAADEGPGVYSGRLKTWLAGVAGQSAGPDAALRAFTPNVSTVGLGGTTQTFDANPYSNPNAANTSFQNTLSPEGQVAPQTGTTADGSNYSVPTAQRAQQAGLGNLVPAQSRFGTGRILLPGSNAPPTSSGASTGGAFGAAGGGGSSDPSASSNGLPAGAMQTGIGPAATAAATMAGTGSAQDLHGLLASVASSGGRLYQLNKALSGLQGAGVTGPGTETTQAIASFLNTQVPFGLGKILPGVNPNQIQSYDEATKYLTQYAANAAGAMGSDSKLATALSSNASTHISNLAAQDVVKATIGIERMQSAQAQAFTATGKPPQDYDQWATTWNRSADPRAYIFDEMNPAQRTTVLNGMSPATRSGFLDQVWNAAQGGYVDPNKLGFSGTPAPANGAPGGAAPAATRPPSVPTGY